MPAQDFFSGRKLKSVRHACEAFFAGIFCGGNVAQAQGMMLPQKTDEHIEFAQFQVSTHGAHTLLELPRGFGRVGVIDRLRAGGVFPCITL